MHNITREVMEENGGVLEGELKSLAFQGGEANAFVGLWPKWDKGMRVFFVHPTLFKHVAQVSGHTNDVRITGTDVLTLQFTTPDYSQVLGDKTEFVDKPATMSPVPLRHVLELMRVTGIAARCIAYDHSDVCLAKSGDMTFNRSVLVAAGQPDFDNRPMVFYAICAECYRLWLKEWKVVNYVPPEERKACCWPEDLSDKYVAILKGWKVPPNATVLVWDIPPR